MDSLVAGSGSTRSTLAWEYHWVVPNLRPFVFTLIAFWESKHPIEEDASMQKMGFYFLDPAVVPAAGTLRPLRASTRAAIVPVLGWDALGRLRLDPVRAPAAPMVIPSAGNR